MGEDTLAEPGAQKQHSANNRTHLCLRAKRCAVSNIARVMLVIRDPGEPKASGDDILADADCTITSMSGGNTFVRDAWF